MNIKKIFPAGTLFVVALGFACDMPPANNSNSTNRTPSNNANANANADAARLAAARCAANGDAIIMGQIPGVIEDDAVLGGISENFNYFSRDCIVYLHGYTTNFSNFKRLDFAMLNVTGVIATNTTDLFLDARDVNRPGNCGPTQEACGAICVPRGTCAIDPPPMGNTNMNANVRKGNVNSTSNKNSNSNR